MSKPRMFATASPMRTAAVSPASSRAMSHTAVTATTHASWLVVPSTSPRPSLRRQSHSSATPTPTAREEEKLPQLVARSPVRARQHGVEHHRAQDGADRVDQ